VPPAPQDGDGPPFWAAGLDGGSLQVQLTNTGTGPWPEGLQLLAAAAASDAPYLSDAPGGLAPLDAAVPALAPGESVVLAVTAPQPENGRGLLWLTLAGPDGPFTDLGSPALQLAAG
jgi:hypothetical protein